MLDKEETLNNLVNKYILDCTNKLLDIDSEFEKQLEEYGISDEEGRKVLKKELGNFVDRICGEIDNDEDGDDISEINKEKISNIMNNMTKYRDDVYDSIYDLRNRLSEILFLELGRRIKDVVEKNMDAGSSLSPYCNNTCLAINKLFETFLIKIKELSCKTIKANDEIINK